jgi:uncharacterized Tic20 family protein
METKTLNPDKTIASLIHLSTFSKYFFPFGNFIAPLILWTVKKEDPFVNEHGRQALNFQISIFLYFIFLMCIGISGILILGMELTSGELFVFTNNFMDIGNTVHAIPLFIFIGVIGLLLLGLFFLDIISVINATIKASEGHLYKYPITINFINTTSVGHHQSKNEQFNNIQNQTL